MARRGGRWIALTMGLFLVGSCRPHIKATPKSSAASAKASAALPAPPVELSNFESDLGSALTTKWQAIDDKGAGGVSTAKAELVAGGPSGSKRCLQVTGTARVESFPFPFAGAALPLGPVVDGQPTPIDLSRYHGVSFWIKGDGKQYMLRFQSEAISDFNFHHYVFTAGPEWKQVRVPFSELSQFSWGTKVPWSAARGQVSAFFIVTYGKPGESVGNFAFQVDDVSFF